ncbi:MAG: 2-C-methyl-D-erythritol 2,4-cyclodiphosphate synthase [Verrucomicrobia bacterium]|nr:2-C-methyl-D-erythritol 2,4-cyclodiphosphate synthase [Verrucomicrobiota bacterium]
MRVGFGYDIHRLVTGRKLVLGGVEIPHPRGLEGHSDADVLSHAIADALLGAIGERDIGYHFPNTDAAIKGMDSQEILQRVQAILAAKRFAIVNIDSTIVAEEPKIGPHLSTMRARLARTLYLPADAIGIKATTNEGLGALGRGEGIAAFAVAGVERVEPSVSPDAPRHVA